MATVEHSLGPDDAAAVRSLYETYDWWADRDEAGIQEALAESDEVVALRDEETDGLVASARVLTDYTYYAMVFDVVVHADRRGEGFGRELMDAVATHPSLSAVTPTLLAREGLVEFYEACGFEPTGPIEHPDGEPEELRFLAFEREESGDGEQADRG